MINCARSRDVGKETFEKSTLSSGFSAFLMLAPAKNISGKNTFDDAFDRFQSITSTPFPLRSCSAKNASLLTQLLFGENLHGIVGVVFLVVRELHNPIAALANYPLKKQLDLL